MRKKFLIFSIVCLLFCTLSYTYSSFKNTIVGNISGNIKDWVFKVNIDNSTKYEDGYKLHLTGTSGSFNVNINTVGGSKYVDYSIELIGDSSIKYYTDSSYTNLISNNIYNGSINSNTSGTTTIYYKSDNNINSDILIKTKAVAKAILIYGIKRDTNSTTTTWERIEDSVGLVANASLPGNENVQNDFDNIYPWSDMKSYNYDANTKNVTAWYGDSNFAFDGSNGEVLTYIPGFYYKREVVDGIEYQYISETEQEGYAYSEPFSVGRYKISGGTDAYHNSSAVSGTTGDVFTGKSKNGVYPSANAALPKFRESASALGTEFSILDYHWYLLQMLYLVEYADYDSQTKLGKGVSSNASGTIIMGGTDSLGMKSGCLINDGAHSMIYRGIEDIYGNTGDFLDGINIRNYQAYINYDFTTYKSDTFDGIYKTLGYINTSSRGFITKLGYDSNNPLIGLPIDATLTDPNTPSGIKDLYLGNSGDKILFVGGAYNNSNFAGLWFSRAADRSDYARSGVSSRLIRHQTSGGWEVANPQEGSSSGGK